MLEKLEKMFGYVAELGVFLTELKLKLGEIYPNNVKTERAVKKYLDGFTITSAAADTSCRDRIRDALQLNKQNLEFWTEKEMKEMPLLRNLKFRRLKGGLYQYRYRRNGYDVAFTSKSLEIAKKKAREFIHSIKATLKEKAESERCTTIDFVAEAWLRLKKAHSDVNTWRGYEGVYRLHIKPVFGKRAVKSILPMDLQPFFDELHERWGRTCENARTVLNCIFKYAMANKLCTSNPMTGVIVEHHARTTGQAMTDEQIKRFKEKMPSEGKYGLAGLILLYSGVRGAELHTMTFDWDAGTFTVDNAKLKQSQKRNPLNLKRTVPIFPGLWKLRKRIESEEWRVSPTRLTNKFKLHWTECTPKDLRHTFSTKAREAGVDNELVNIWMGHSAGPNLTANTYTHFSVKFQIAQAKKIVNY